MRTIRLLTFPLLAALLLAMPSVGRCQYPAFTLAGLGTAPSVSIVRTYTATQAVAYYRQGGHGYIALVDVSGNVKQTKLDTLYAVQDMRVVGDELYFCGQYNGYGCIGHLDLAALDAGVPVVDNYSDNMLVPFYHMVAYKIDGVVKVVAIGLKYSNGVPCFCPVVMPPYSCADYRILEADFVGGNLANALYMNVNAPGLPVEELYDVVETDGYVAVLAVDRTGNELAVHACDKHNVLATFGQYSAYPTSAGLESQEGYVGCHVKGDEIAVSSLATVLSVNHDYYTQVRTIDLSTQTMTTAQQFKLLEKTLPIEMVYYPTHSTLVLLQPQELNTYGWQSVFVHLQPYDPAPYWANTYFESARGLDFVSMDKAGSDHYLSAGGDYWLLKDVNAAPSAVGCFTQIQTEVRDIPKELGLDRGKGVTPSPWSIPSTNSNDFSSLIYSIICQQP